MSAPIKTAMSELMMRLRSSFRCSKKVIAPAGSSVGVVVCELDSGSVKGLSRMPLVMGRFFGARDRCGFVPGFSRFFSGVRNRFGYRRDYGRFRNEGIWVGLDHGRLRPSGTSRRECWVGLGCGGGGSSGFCSLLALGLHRLALHFAHFFFKGALEVRGGLAKLGH